MGAGATKVARRESAHHCDEQRAWCCGRAARPVPHRSGQQHRVRIFGDAKSASPCLNRRPWKSRPAARSRSSPRICGPRTTCNRSVRVGASGADAAPSAPCRAGACAMRPSSFSLAHHRVEHARQDALKASVSWLSMNAPRAASWSPLRLVPDDDAARDERSCHVAASTRPTDLGCPTRGCSAATWSIIGRRAQGISKVFRRGGHRSERPRPAAIENTRCRVVSFPSNRPNRWTVLEKALPGGVPCGNRRCAKIRALPLVSCWTRLQRHRDARTVLPLRRPERFAQVDPPRGPGRHIRGVGLDAGDRVAIMMPNVPQYPVAVAAILPPGSPSSASARCTRRASSSAS